MAGARYEELGTSRKEEDSLCQVGIEQIEVDGFRNMVFWVCENDFGNT